jgi:GTP-binding protein
VSYDNFIGRLLIGRVRSGRLLKGVPIGISSGPGEAPRMVKCSQIFKFAAFARQPVDEASAGDIVVAAGIPDFNIGDTLVDLKTPMPLPPIAVEQPTMSITLGVNRSPFKGKSGAKYLTSANIRERLARERTHEHRELAARRVDEAGPSRADG